MEKKHILIVEDDSATQVLYRSQLGGDYRLDIVDNTEAARNILESSEPSLVIVDLSLVGEEGGLRLIQYLREEFERPDIPILVVTAHAFDQDRERSIAAGCDEFLPKPISGPALLEKIEEYI